MKGLELDKVDFAVNGYKVDKVKYPQQGSKEPSSSSKKKMKMDDTMTINLSKEEFDDDEHNDKLVQLS